ncbi:MULTISPECIES: DDE-type integrase/transposase/recombinase [unclassified Streptomyces]|uniref:DDE-type integrase/transposase/recombinase n=1 Tax=unclassified Streptomyces TaxID=2593676 RepID=UPI002DD7EECF|nr:MULTISPECIES: DDE-type integrase/transposase/recombinase [unclassified Streptomyces]WSE00974.1 DDE-type integrase/transposase/recombinase [Streptomyces sp. NBC_01474]
MNTIAKIMAELGLAGRTVRRRRGLTRPGRRPASPDFVRRDFTVEAPDLVWSGDMTEIETGEGKLYMATVIDLFSRRLVGYAMGERHDAGLVVAALNMAAATRGGEHGPVTGFRGRRLGVGGMARVRRNGAAAIERDGTVVQDAALRALAIARRAAGFCGLTTRSRHWVRVACSLSSQRWCPYVFGQGKRDCAEPWGQAAWRCG